MYMLDRGIVHVLVWTSWDGTRFHPTVQNSMHLFYELFASGIFHLMFLDCVGLWATKTAETMAKGGTIVYLYVYIYLMII